MDGWERRAANGPKAAQEGERGAPRRAELAARPSAVGPRAQAGADRPNPGRKVVWAASTVTFHLYSEAFSYYFVNIFDLYSNLNQRDNLFREK